MDSIIDRDDLETRGRSREDGAIRAVIHRGSTPFDRAGGGMESHARHGIDS